MSDAAERSRGRPTVYTEDIAAEVCQRLADGEPLRKICQDEHLPTDTCIRLWALRDHMGFFSRYMQAREVQAMRWSEEVTEIIDDTGAEDSNVAVARARLRMDGRLHLMRMIVPRIFGRSEDGEKAAVTVKIVRLSDDK